MQEDHPVVHLHEDAAFGAVFCEVEVGRDDAVEFGNVGLVEIVLGDGYVRLENFPRGCVFPSGETHVEFGGIDGCVNLFGGGFTRDGPVEFVLHSGKKIACDRCFAVIVHGERVDVRDFLIETSLA